MCTTVPSSSWKSLLWEFVFFVVIWQSGGWFIFCHLVTVFKFIQIGLDGIRMLDPNTSRTLRIYPLENITRCDVSQLYFLQFLTLFSSIIIIVNILLNIEFALSSYVENGFIYLCILVQEFCGYWPKTY